MYGRAMSVYILSPGIVEIDTKPFDVSCCNQPCLAASLPSVGTAPKRGCGAKTAPGVA